MTDEKNEFGVGEFGGQFGGSAGVSDVKTIIDDGMRQAGINPENESYRKTALSFLNQVYTTALKGKHWKFMNKELAIELDPVYEVGKISLTEGEHEVSEYVAGGNPPITKWNATHEGRMLHPKGFREGFYRIEEVKSQSELIVSPGFSDESTTEGTDYRIIQDRYLLDAKVQNVKSVRAIGYREMQPMGLAEFREEKSLNYTLTGIPRFYTITQVDAQAGQLLMEFYPAPDVRYGVHIEYNARVGRLEDSETCYTLLPPEHSDVLVLGLRGLLLEDQNNIALADRVNAKALSAWNRMASDYEVQDGQPRIQAHRRNIRNRWGRRSHVFFGRKHFGRFD